MSQLRLRALVYFASIIALVAFAFGEWRNAILAVIFFCAGWLICRLHDEYQRTMNGS